MYNLTERLVLSSVFVYNTGNAITYPVGKYNVGGQSVFEYGARNANRMPGYNRLDLSVTYENKLKKRMGGAWNFSLFNVYGQENPCLNGCPPFLTPLLFSYEV
jgi:outer membrane receptor protein involved in Fe transport